MAKLTFNPIFTNAEDVACNGILSIPEKGMHVDTCKYYHMDEL